MGAMPRKTVMETKTCKGCGVDKPITDFGRDSSKKTGLKGKCKQCRATDKRALHVHHGRERQLQYRHENRDKRLAQKAVDRAVQSGRLPRVGENPCVVCQVQAQEYHHWSYEPADQLSVIPLCALHHRLIHTGEISLNNPKDYAIKG